MGSPLWMVELLKKTFPTRKYLAMLTNMPLLGRIVDKMLFEGDDIIYLPRDAVVEIKIGKGLERPEEMTLPSEIVHHFIEKANYHWVMNKCICRDALTCEDYPIDLGCLFMGEAAKGINPNLGKRVTKEEAHEHIKKCGEAGLVHMIGRNKLDTVWLSVGPGEKLLTVCNCCPCCCLWRMLPDVNPEISQKITKMSGVQVKANENCNGCKRCIDQCFASAIKLVNGKAFITDACRGCGRCVEVCFHDAIDLTIDNEDYVKVSVDRISPLVDVEQIGYSSVFNLEQPFSRV